MILPEKNSLILTPYPVNLILEITTNCNLSCNLCPRSSMKRSKGQMPDEIYYKIIKEISKYSPDDTIVWFAFMGEPLLVGLSLITKIKKAKELGIKNLYINTNAMFLNNDTSNLIIDSGATRIIASVDAASEEQYNKIRIGGNYDVVCNNIINFLSKKSDVEVYVQFIVTDENKHEIESFKKMWLNYGATVKIRKKLGWGTSVKTYLEGKERNIPCPWLMRQMVILWDGTVAQCDADFDGKYSAGNVNDKSIYNIWNNALYDRRIKHIKGNFDFSPCDTCKDWEVGISDVFKPV